MLKCLRWILLLLSLLVACGVQAEGRTFPMGTKAGDLKEAKYPQLRIGDMVYRMAPGVRVFDQFNRLLLPNMMPQSGKVSYQLDVRGEVSQIWMLTAEEASQIKP